MISNELINSVLESAFSGNLIKNDPSLPKIEIKTKNNSSYCEIPNNWCWVNLDDIITLQQGVQIDTTEQKKEEFENSIKFLRIINFTQDMDDMRWVDKKHISEKSLINSSDLVMVRYGATSGNIYFGVDGLLANNLFKINLEYDFINKKYIYYYFNSSVIKSKILGDKGDTAMPSINFTAMRKILIPLPPVEEQQRIVDKIEKIFKELEEIKPIEDELKDLKIRFSTDMKSSILNELYLGKSEFLSEKYESWNNKPLKKLADICTGNSISESVKKSKYSNLSEGYNYIATKDLEFDHSFNYENGIKIPYSENGFRYANSNDILMCIEGGSAGKKIGILSEKVCYGNKLCKFSLLSNELIPKYVYYYLQSPVFLKNFYENMSGIIGGVSINKIKDLVIYYPSVKEQQRIVDKIEKLLPLCDDIDYLVNN